MTSDVLAAVDRVLPRVREDLARLIAIPSISADPEHRADVRRSADFVAERLREIGCPDVEVVAEGGQPAVIGRFPAPEGQPTVTLYAHHDVQPTGDRSSWTVDPFTAEERDGRLYARGAADDKGGVGVHLATLRAFDGKPPVGVTLFIEGEEEIGSPSLSNIFARHGDKLACDVFVITDSGNWEIGVPAFTTSLRGMAEIYVQVTTLDHAVHSGQYGGVVPDAMLALIKLLATLHDDAGNVAVEGLRSTLAPELEYPEDRLRAEAGILDGVSLIGDGSLVSRMWTKPSLTVIGLDCTPVDQASNTLIPSARAKISLRVAPGDEAARAQQHVVDHLLRHAPFGAAVDVQVGESGEPFEVSLDGAYASVAAEAYAETWGRAPVPMGMGGSIPLAAEYARLNPDALILLTAVVDPDARMHGIDESLHLGDFERACRAEALFLQRLAHDRG